MNKQGDQVGKICIAKTSSVNNGYLKISCLKQIYSNHCNGELDWYLIRFAVNLLYELLARVHNLREIG